MLIVFGVQFTVYLYLCSPNRKSHSLIPVEV